ncbi:pyridoxal-dependent decarboxylase domain protein [Pleomassaria siparia CBS 279.74]|uniref:Pyridoxal-dependent decarboxylase domain protein n=1 Tax=Pleomassaria siparia CBS 279.74 TaxID=1314801 RepID=A0A6G1JRK4_9PLEO|nr:pyridoxal-dependent decarboxylase domain protein [Pleomassaria siparia CBS 279.74]
MPTLKKGNNALSSVLEFPKQGFVSTDKTVHNPEAGHNSTDSAVEVPNGAAKTNVVNSFTHGASHNSEGDKSHQAISSYFLGPQAENLDFFKKNIDVILEESRKARVNYYPGDGEFITNDIQASETFKARTNEVAKAIEATSKMLAKHQIPFWSPRYQAHMCTDLSMPAVLGYLATMMYNPNNVAFEASPLTTIIEMEVGKQLSTLFGYNLNENDPTNPQPWGHITCDGTIANLESIWSARNLKFYPLSIRQALDGPLSFIAGSFKIKTSQNFEKIFTKLTTWELLNLKPEAVLDIPDRLNNEYGISSKFLEDVLDTFGIQSRGKDSLEREFGITKPAQYIVSNTRHYSWPKGAAIAGIGSDNVVGVDVDHGARIDVRKLEECLHKHLRDEQAVYAVVAIIGSTEEGAVDPLGEILALHRRFQARGLSFLVHADAAWGGYFASMLPRDYSPGMGGVLPVDPTGGGISEGFVPDSSLRVETQEDIWWLRHADSITVDPHKAGYIPYPAGGLCYKDGRLKNLLTWTTPYLSQGSSLNIGVYGVEGSKPGASAVSTFLSNKCIGLDPEGYGALLGEVTFSCSRLSAQWAAMTDDKTSYIVVPFNMLPSELVRGATPDSVAAERQWIRDHILSSSNLNIVANSTTSPGGDTALSLLRKLGSDLNINAFAINFRNHDGTLNTDTLEANKLMQRVVSHFMVDTPADDPTKIPLYLTSTEFSPKLYGECAKNFKRRLGLDTEDGHDLFVLRNVVMSPFPTERDFITDLTNIFKGVVESEVKTAQKRSMSSPADHEFLMQGSDKIFLVHKPSFHAANMRRQTILEVDLPAEGKAWYQTLQSQYPDDVFTFKAHVDLAQAIRGSESISGYMYSKFTGPIPPPLMVKIVNVIIDRPLNGSTHSAKYPKDRMPFYLYGSFPKSEYHIDHALLRDPNIQLSAGNVSISIDGTIDPTETSLLLTLDLVREQVLQPFPDRTTVLTALPSFFFFTQGKKLEISVWRDPVKRTERSGKHILDAWEALDKQHLLGKGTMTLGDSVYVDCEMLNLDPDKTVDNEDAWKKEFEKYLEDVGKH